MERKNFQKRGPNQNQGQYQGSNYQRGGYEGRGGQERRPPTSGGQNIYRGNYQNDQNQFNKGGRDFKYENGPKRFETNQQNYQGGYQKSQFPSRPTKSLVTMSINPEEAKSQKVQVFTNQFKMKIGKNAPQMYQYPINIEDDPEFPNSLKINAFEMEKIVNKNDKRIELLVGKFFQSGFNIWTTQQLSETYFIDVKWMGQKARLKIDHVGQYIVNTSDIHDASSRQDCQAMSQILNIIVKQAMSETGMIQFGNRPKFFDDKSAINVETLNMQIWQGFKTSAYKYASGCALIVDNCSRFMSTKNVLTCIQQIYDEVEANDSQNKKWLDIFQHKCKAQFVNQSIVANYGNKRTYIVKDINFDKGPCATFFDLKNGEKMSVAKYFYQTYNLKVSDKKQPMLIVSQGGRNIQIPSEFCLTDGVPDSIRNCSRSMRTLLGTVKQNPIQKMSSIVEMIQNLFKMSKWKEWDIQVENQPEKLESRRLAVPELIHKEGDDQKLFCSERLLKQMPVFNSNALSQKQIVVFYDEQLQNQELDNLLKNLTNCQDQIGMKSKPLKRMPIQNCRNNYQKLKQTLEYSIESLKKKSYDNEKNENIFALIVVNYENEYQNFKNIFTSMNILSQCVLKRTVRKFNMSVASNIMKQINSKIGGESVRIKLPQFMNTSKVMIVGIDVCHQGKNSIVGFSASTNRYCTSFYSDVIIQAKNQEIVKKDLDRCLVKALAEFKSIEKETPDKIIIYRDGVGEGMRDMIITNEISQFKETLKGHFNSANIPKITLIVVNKRINQRIFVKKGDEMQNPEPGTIIDSVLVENNESNKCYDFFLVPQQTTQGCVTPTHFFVSMNESYADVSKQQIEDLTFCLCFMYTNWSGSIKVPSPCQYAHKIAEYHHNFDQQGIIKKSKNVDMSSLAYNPNFLTYQYYL